MMQRYEIINYLVDQFVDCRYLEIGSLCRENFNLIHAEIKHDVEPNPRGFIPTFRMTSDEFFQNCKYELTNSSLVKRVYDVIFIDGSHLCEQVIRDVHNSVYALSDNGFIVLHDCFPATKEKQERNQVELEWCGDAWKAQAWLCSKFQNVYTVKNSNQGCGIIKGKIEFEIPKTEELFKYKWEDLNEEIIRTIEWEKLWSTDKH